MIKSNPAAERGVLSGICRYGAEAYLDICDLIRETSFTDESNQIIYKCLRHILDEDHNASVDIPSIYSTANTLGLGYVFEKKAESQHLQAIFSSPVELRSVRKFAQQISKLEIGRLLDSQLSVAKDRLRDINGEESLAHILGIAENAIFDFSSLINQKVETSKLGDGLHDLLKHLEENPVDNVGVPTPFGLLNKALGGGLRTGVTVIGARIKQGKSFLGDNIGVYIAENVCPVLNIDTEMLIKDHQMRTTALLSKVPINDIETGKFGMDSIKRDKVYQAGKKLTSIPYYHQCISGMPFEEQISVMRRWIAKEVGLKPDGTAKPCVIVYDYIKLMSDEGINNNIAEYQAIGFMMTALHNFANRYNIPILAFVQLNRDGVTKETSDVAAQSDRILWLCIAFLIWKSKSDEEIAQDGPDAGNKKLISVVGRYGEAMGFGEYINYKFEGWCGKITEGKLASDVSKSGNPVVDQGFETSATDDDETVPFE